MLRAVRYAIAGLAVCGSVFALVLALASSCYRQNTPASAAIAVRLIPFRASYLVRLASWDASARNGALQRAVEANPFETQAWIDLGLDAEFRANDAPRAERFFREAASRNNMFVPRWTLANFYFRHERPAEFLKWAKATLEVTPYAAAPVFAEMWLLLPNDPETLAQAVPNLPNSLWQYAWYLSNAGQFQAIPPIVSRLVEHASPSDAETFGRSTIIGPLADRLLQRGFSGEASAVWNSLYAGHWVRFAAPTVDRPVSNGSFGTPIWPHGFDWMPVATLGVSTEQRTYERSIAIDFSGDQPDPSTVLQQWIPLAAGRTYTLHWTLKADSADTAAGLAWHIRTGTGQDVAASSGFAEAFGRWRFRFPAADGVYLLSLEYARQPGYTRAKGEALLSAVRSDME